MISVRNLNILMFGLIQKNTNNKVVAYTCTCAILSLLRLVINIAIAVDILKIRIIPRGRTSALALVAPFTLVDIVHCLK